MLKIAGIYGSNGTIDLEHGRQISWNELSEENPPELPLMSKIILTISFDENDLLDDKNGIVWATYDLRQSEIIQSALLAQQINSEIKEIDLREKRLYLIKILNQTDINDASDFIWRSHSGLRLKPDWSYPASEINKSFEQWLSGQ